MTFRTKKGDFGVIARQRETMCMQLQRRRTVDTDDHCRTFPARELLVWWVLRRQREPYNCRLFAVKVSILDAYRDAYLRGRAWNFSDCIDRSVNSNINAEEPSWDFLRCHEQSVR